MGSLSPMDFHQYPSICKVALSYKYFLAIIALQGDFGNKFRKEQPHLALRTLQFMTMDSIMNSQ